MNKFTAMPAKGAISSSVAINELTGLSRYLMEARVTQNLCNITKSDLTVGDDCREVASPGLPTYSRTCKGQLQLGARMEWSTVAIRVTWRPSPHC